MQAKYYLYRNLHTGTFSLKHRGRVIKHPTTCLMSVVEFRVSEAGRKRVLKEKRKNVHATVAAQSYDDKYTEYNLDDYEEIYYNPYKTDKFIDPEGCPVYKAQEVLCTNNKIYIKKNILK